ncbi:WD40 repeat domain-containing protein [Shinella sp.]|uniref:WD40 repeat domain-containing protein n=1 Tax=Shinella sp. TaxID=1870904 RepID=UPI0029B05408|nr:WD40 repeat domain-containing protein [Shinella sp.]MDX3978229.1 WD40 repeat domain-containing protein [Shinella sp.]
MADDNPLSRLVRTAPLPVAVLAQMAMVEKEPELIVLKCARTFEIIARLYCFLGLAARQKPNLTGQKPYELGSGLQRPSLGRWCGSVKKIAEMQGQDPAYRSEALRFYHRLNDSEIMPRRNDVAHKFGSASITPDRVQRICDELGGWLDDAPWFANLRWLAMQPDGTMVHLDRLGALEQDPPADLEPGRVLLGQGDQWIDLSGWLNLETGTDFLRKGRASLQIYSGYDDRQVLYDVLELEAGVPAFSHIVDTRPMLETEQVAVWVVDRQKAIGEAPDAEKEFLDIIHSDKTVPRDLSLYQPLLDDGPGVVLFSGTRGSGKTNFLAQLWNWQRQQADNLQFTFSIGSSKGSGGAQQFLLSFYRFLIKSEIIKLEKRAAQKIEEIHGEIAKAVETIQRPMTVFLDNVHRALRDQPAIVDLILQTSGSVLWVCSTREGNLDALQERLLRRGQEVPAFTRQETIRYLDNLGGNISQRLREMEDGGAGFVDLLTEKSSGNPTYIGLVHVALLKAQIDDVMNDLPSGLKRWIEKHYIEKRAETDFERREADIRWMVAAALAPISLETVLDLFGRDEQTIGSYRDAFDRGTPELILDRNGLLRFRDSAFDEVLGSSNSSELSSAKKNIAERAMNLHVGSSDRHITTTKYLFEYGCRHLAGSPSLRGVGRKLLSDQRYLTDRFKVLGDKDTPIEQMVHAITRDWAIVVDNSDAPTYDAWRAESHMLSRLHSCAEAPVVLEQVANRWQLTPDVDRPQLHAGAFPERLVLDRSLAVLEGVTVLAGHHAPITLMRLNPWQDRVHRQFVSLDAGGTVIVWGVRWADSMSPSINAAEDAPMVIDAVWLMIDTLALLCDNGALFLWSVGKDAGRVNPLTEVDTKAEGGFAGIAANPKGSPWCLAWTRKGVLVRLSLSSADGHRTVVAKEVGRAEELDGIFGVSVVDRKAGILVLGWSLAGTIHPLDQNLRPTADKLDFGPPIKSFFSPDQSALLLQDTFHRTVLVNDDVRVGRHKIGKVLTVDWEHPRRPIAWTADGPHALTNELDEASQRAAPSLSSRLVRAIPVSSGVLAVDSEGHAVLLNETESSSIPALRRAKLHANALPLPFGRGGGIVDGTHSKMWLWDGQDEWTTSLDSEVRLILPLSSDVFATASDDLIVRLYRKRDILVGGISRIILPSAVIGLVVLSSGIVVAWDGTDCITMIGRQWDDVLNIDLSHRIRCCDGRLVGVQPFGDGILTWGEDGTIRHWGILASGGLRHIRDIGHHGAGVAGAFIYEADQLISWSADGTVRVWPLRGDKRHHAKIFSGFLDCVKDVYVLPDERLAARTSDDQWFVCNLRDGSSRSMTSQCIEKWLSPNEQAPTIRCGGTIDGFSIVWTSTWVALVDGATGEERSRWYSREIITRVEIWNEKAVVIGCADGAILKLVIERRQRLAGRKDWV